MDSFKNNHQLNVKGELDLELDLDLKSSDKCIHFNVCINQFDANILFIQVSTHHFNMAQLQQCCLFHGPLLPLLCNQVVASETSRKTSSSCVATKEKNWV